jgi:hypothetical protein
VWSFSLRLFVRFLTAVRVFRYGSSCISLRPFVHSVKDLRAFPYGRSCALLRLFVHFLTVVHAFRYGSSCVSLRPFVHSVTALRAFGRPYCQPTLHCIWVPLLPTCLALPLVAQPWPGSSCFSLRLFVHLGAHVAKSPCIAFGHPSCELTLRCIRAPNLSEVVLKNLPPSQNWFLSILRLVFLPSAPLCGRFRYGSSCVSLRPFVHFITALRAFGHPSC